MRGSPAHRAPCFRGFRGECCTYLSHVPGVLCYSTYPLSCSVPRHQQQDVSLYLSLPFLALAFLTISYTCIQPCKERPIGESLPLAAAKSWRRALQLDPLPLDLATTSICTEKEMLWGRYSSARRRRTFCVFPSKNRGYLHRPLCNSFARKVQVIRVKPDIKYIPAWSSRSPQTG